jgi:type IV secretory pathway VirD2 relaxase
MAQSMDNDDSFTPRLGRIRHQGGKRARKYLGRVLAATNLARGGAFAPTGKSAFTGSRIGRGAGVGRMLASRAGMAAFRQRRVIVKARIVKLAGKGLSGATAHLRYLQRDGTTRDGAPGKLYGPESDAVDGREFRERGSGDRHQFRFIVSPEDGAEFDDLKSLTRRLMTRVEQDLGTRLDWVAVDHFNTGHPHTHIVVRGKDHLGADLIIAREYLTSGIRERAAELIDLDLGPRSLREVEQGLTAEMEQERFTSIDRSLLRDIDGDRVVAAKGQTSFDQTLRAGRLVKLERLGLAEPLGAGRWHLAEGLDETLKRMGERGDIIRTMQREVSRVALDRPVADQVIFDPTSSEVRPLVGRVVARGLDDEHADRHFLIVDGVDGRSHYIAIGKGETLAPVPSDAIVRITPRQADVRDADRTVAAIAAANGDRYDIDAHLRQDPGATQDFAEAHVRRLEALRRARVGVERDPTGVWTIAPDHLERVAGHERATLRDRPVVVEILSTVPLGKLADVEAATWLDRDAVSATPEPLRDAGFGREVLTAQTQRRQWLIAEGLVEEREGVVTYRADLIATLQRRELLKVTGQLADDLAVPFVEASPGARIEGVYRRPVDLVSGRFALIEKSREFTLVPWRPVLEHQVGKQVAGIMREGGISWSVGRGRGGPTIS